MEYLSEKWQILVAILLHLIFCLPIIVYNIFMLSIFFVYFLFILFVIIIPTRMIPKRYQKKIVVLSESKSAEETKSKIGKIAFKFGCFISDLQEDLTDFIPLKIPRRTIIFPFQRWLYNSYAQYYESGIRGFFKGIENRLKTDKDLNKESKEIIQESNNKKIHFIVSLKNLIINISKTILFFLILLLISFPTLLLLFYLILLFR